VLPGNQQGDLGGLDIDQFCLADNITLRQPFAVDDSLAAVGAD
jgi:hypothetical protein